MSNRFYVDEPDAFVIVDDSVESWEPIATNEGRWVTIDGNPVFIEDARTSAGSGDEFVQTEKMFTKQELERMPKSLPPQPVKTQQELYRLADVVYPNFVEDLDHGQGVDKELGGKTVYPKSPEDFQAVLDEEGPLVIMAPTKGLKRATEKVNGKLGGDWSKLSDVVRATVAVDSKQDIPRAVESLKRVMNEDGWSLVEFDNRMANPLAGGYRDLATKWRSPEGMITEIQINTKPILKVKETIGHKIYEKIRVIEEGAIGRDYTADELGTLDRLKSQVAKEYEKAWR